jgi:O-antigen/teichoic acid export membrane protein
MRLRHALPAGLFDAGFASLATLAVGVYAARTLTPAELGAYALFFTAFLFATVVPTQLVLAPAEFSTIPLERIERIGLLRHIWVIGLPSAAIAAIVGAAVAYAGARAPDDLLRVLAVTTIVAAFVSPLQDHVRRVLHMAGLSWHAMSVSIFQLLSVIGFLLLFQAVHVSSIWRPFGALAFANLISMSVGLAMVRHQVRAFPLSRPRLSDLMRSGRWLMSLECVTTGGLLLSSVMITHLASPVVLGHAEAARIVAQPMFVLMVGLNAILGPRSIEAAANRDLAAANRILRPFLLIITVAGLGYGAATATRWGGNPIAVLVPQAYAVEGLVSITVLAQVVYVSSATLRAELIGGKREHVLPGVAIVASLLQCLVAIAAIWTGALARPLGILLSGAVLFLGYLWYRHPMYRHGSATLVGRGMARH